jgi:hypothetical protein
MGKLNSNLYEYSPTLLPFERLRGARAMNALELTYGVKSGELLMSKKVIFGKKSTQPKKTLKAITPSARRRRLHAIHSISTEDGAHGHHGGDGVPRRRQDHAGQLRAQRRPRIPRCVFVELGSVAIDLSERAVVLHPYHTHAHTHTDVRACGEPSTTWQASKLTY